MSRGGKREGAGRPRMDTTRRSIPDDILGIVDAMLFERKKHGTNSFLVISENKAGFQKELKSGVFLGKEPIDDRVRLYIDSSLRPMIEKIDDVTAVFVGDINGVKGAMKVMKKGMDLETFKFLAEVNGLTQER